MTPKPVQGLAYLASPYSKYYLGRDMAYEVACLKAAQLMKEGWNIFCPIAHSHAIETVAMDEIKEGDFWLKQDYAVLKNCEKLLVFKMYGWDESYGVQEEIKFAQQHNIPIEYLEYDYTLV